MLNKDLPPQSVIAGVLHRMLDDAMNNTEFMNSLAQKVAVALQERDVKLEEVRKAFQEGINSGRGNSAERVFDRLEAKYSAMVTGSGA